MNKLALFEEKEIRKKWKDNDWYFCIEDIVYALTDSKNPKEYVKKLKQRDEELNKGWGQIVHTLQFETAGGKQRMNSANTQGILRIIQSIPSPKAEPFKRWLAEVGAERIEEINDPELAVKRARDTYKLKGYNEQWINNRMFGIEARNKLTDEWKYRGLKESKDYAILTNQIYKGTLNLNAKELKTIKGIPNESKANLRDRMNPLELNIVSLAELTSQELHNKNNSHGKEELSKDVKVASKIASNTRKEIESKLGKSIISSNKEIK